MVKQNKVDLVIVILWIQFVNNVPVKLAEGADIGNALYKWDRIHQESMRNPVRVFTGDILQGVQKNLSYKTKKLLN